MVVVVFDCIIVRTDLRQCIATLRSDTADAADAADAATLEAEADEAEAEDAEEEALAEAAAERRHRLAIDNTSPALSSKRIVPSSLFPLPTPE